MTLNPERVASRLASLAIAASVGRLKDRARTEQMLEQAELDRALLAAILERHHLKLPQP